MLVRDACFYRKRGTEEEKNTYFIQAHSWTSDTDSLIVDTPRISISNDEMFDKNH